MASPSARNDELAATLQGIWSSGLPLAERRRLCRAATISRAGGANPAAQAVQAQGGRSHDYDALFEEILAEIGIECNLGYRPGISEAKAILRGRRAGPSGAGHLLASRLGRLSRLRNSATHDATSQALRSEVSSFLRLDEGIFQHSDEDENPGGVVTPDPYTAGYSALQHEHEAQNILEGMGSQDNAVTELSAADSPANWWAGPIYVVAPGVAEQTEQTEQTDVNHSTNLCDEVAGLINDVDDSLQAVSDFVSQETEHYILSNDEGGSESADDVYDDMSVMSSFTFLADDLRSESDGALPHDGDAGDDDAIPVVFSKAEGKGYGASQHTVIKKSGKIEKEVVKAKHFTHKAVDSPTSSQNAAAASSSSDVFMDSKSKLELLVDSGMDMQSAFKEAFGRSLISHGT